MKFLQIFLFALLPLLNIYSTEIENNEYCFRCHSMATLGVKIDEQGTLKSFTVIPEEFKASNHGKFLCVKCHEIGFETFPHDKSKFEEISCFECHERNNNELFVNFAEIENDFKQSVHNQKLGDKFSCYSCHDPHSFKVNARFSFDINSTVLYDNKICMDCHTNQNRFNALTDRYFPGLQETHSWLPHQNLHWQNVRCIDCHAEPVEGRVSHLIMPKEKAVKNCVECHSKDTRLAQTLYQFQAKQERNTEGFFNSIILNNSYVIGATRNYYLNIFSFVIFGLVIGGISIHGFIYYRAKQSATENEAIHKEYFYPLWLRIWHWLNALFFILLIFSGINLQYSGSENPVIDFSLAITIHNTAGILLTVNYFIFFILNLVTGNYKQYIPKLKELFKRLFVQAKFYVTGIFKNEPHPFEITKNSKFNPLQQITYLNIMYLLVPVIIISGWALLFPDVIIEKILGENGLFPTAVLHTIAGFLLSIFMFGHIYLATTGKKITSGIKSMITGWHESEKNHE